jgi:hypothetical protein
MSERKTTMAIYLSEKVKDEFLKSIGWSENSEQSLNEFLIEHVIKPIIDKTSPTPELTNKKNWSVTLDINDPLNQKLLEISKQFPNESELVKYALDVFIQAYANANTKALYEQYLKDTSDFDWSKIPKDQPKEPTENESKENPLEFAHQNPCPYRTVVQEKGKFLVLCAEEDKIPLEACVTRQKRFLHMERKCKPLSYKPPIKRWQQRAQQEPRTKIYRGDSDYFNPSDDYFKDDWGATP